MHHTVLNSSKMPYFESIPAPARHFPRARAQPALTSRRNRTGAAWRSGWNQKSDKELTGIRGAGRAQVWLYMIMHACDVEMNAEVDALVGMVKMPSNPK